MGFKIQASFLFDGVPQGGRGGYHYADSKSEMRDLAKRYISDQRREWGGLMMCHEFPHAEKWEIRYSDYCGGETVLCR